MSNVKKSNTSTMDEVHKKFNLTQWCSHTMRSILRWNMKIIENAPKHILWSFWRFSVTIISDIKIDVRVCEPHCGKLKFLWTSFIVNIFDFLTFDICPYCMPLSLVTCLHTLPHDPTPWHMTPHPATCHHPAKCPHTRHMSPPLSLPYTPSPCDMPPPPATWPHTLHHALTSCHMSPYYAPCPTPATCPHPCHRPDPLPHTSDAPTPC